MFVTMAPTPQAQPTSTQAKDPLRELIERMDQHRHAIAAHDPRLSQQIESLALKVQDNNALGDPHFRTRAAYIYQDFVRLAGAAAGMPDRLRNELEQLATTAPGLSNQRIHDMLRETPNLNNMKLISDIRQLAFSVGREGGDQNRADVLDRVESLEQKLALLSSGPAASRSKPGIPAQGSVELNQPQLAQPQASSSQSKPEERVHAAISPGEGTRPVSAPPAPHIPAAQTQTSAPRSPEAHQSTAATASTQGVDNSQGNRSVGVLGRAMVMMAEPRSDIRPPWEHPPTPIGERIERFASRFSDNTAVELAERSGQKAVEALRGFAQGAGAGVMARINEAARSDRQGMQGVLSEMREGGRHAELRTQFNNALVQEKGVAASYDAATSAVKQYGADRQAAEAVMLKRPEAGVLAGRFERLDAQIGEAAGQVPARQEGKSVMDELGQKVAELVRRATEAIRSAIQGGPRASATASSSPSPGP